jgi:hypothetical protein
MQTPNEKIAAPEWIKMFELRPPKNATVLMWYPGTEMVGPWCKVDRLENIVLCFPEYWSRINPPNDPKLSHGAKTDDSQNAGGAK